jgi:signal transduction histidine kinase
MVRQRRAASRVSHSVLVWALTASLFAACAGIFSLERGISVPLVTGPDVPWWLLAAGFAIAEVFVMHLRIARHAHSFSLSEIPIVLGLAFVAPGHLVIAQAVGMGLALAIHRRQRPLRLAFNVGQRSFTALVAFAVVAGLRVRLGPGWLGVWASIFAAMLIADVVGGLLINLAISLSEGKLSLFDQVVGIGTALTFANTSLALVAMMVVLQHPAAVILVAVPAATTFLAGKAFADLQRRHENLVQLQRSTGLVQRSLNRQEMIPALLQHVREMFNADVAELMLWPTDGDDVHVRYQAGPGRDETISQVVSLDPGVGVWARVASEREGVLLPRPIRNEALRSSYEHVGIRDAVVAPVLSDDDLLGILTIGNRMGDFSTFDEVDLELLRTLANHFGVAMRNSFLLERLERALEHETEIGRVKDDFIATISHELRTPLTNVQGYLKTLLRPGVTLAPEEQHEFLSSADRNSERLKRLIEDLLYASRIESSGSTDEPPRDVIGLADLIDRVVGDEVPDGRHERVIVALPSDLPTIRSREEDVYRIVRNLVENALKYSLVPVTVSARVEGAGVTIRVQDGGPGIEPHERGRIFDRFYQVDQSTTRRVGGTGMGLYICRRAAECVGARVWLERSDPSGSVFALWLPIDPSLEDRQEGLVPIALPASV